MRTFSANIMVILTILIFHSSQVHSQVLQDKTILNWTIQNSDEIFEGRIVSSESFWSKDKETIITKNQVAVSKHFKGSNISNIYL